MLGLHSWQQGFVLAPGTISEKDHTQGLMSEAQTFPFLSPSGAIEHRERPNIPVKHFTQADVNNGKIVYRPPAAPSHLQELYQYSFIGEISFSNVQPGE